MRRNRNEKRRNNINPNPILEEGIHKAIIEEELWDKVQLMIQQKAGKPSRIYDGEYPLTGILTCPECGAGMVISRVVNKKKDGSKHKLTYYACGNWKNKGTAVCHSNIVGVEKIKEGVYQKLEQILKDEKFFHEVVCRVNREHEIVKANADKDRSIQMKELERLQKRQAKKFESYENGIISREEFLERKAELNKQKEAMRQRSNETAMTLLTEEKRERAEERIQCMLQKFGSVLSSDIDRTIRKTIVTKQRRYTPPQMVCRLFFCSEN